MNVWIVDSESGVTILYKDSLGLEIDEDLVSSLLTALNLFSKHELDQSGIESIDMSGLKWVYSHAPEFTLLFIAADKKETHAEILRSRLIVIKKDFLSHYAKTSSEWKEKWKGLVKPFKSYGDQIDEFMVQWKETEKIESYGILFDSLGVFQQILNICATVIEKYISGFRKERIYRNIENFYSRFIEAIQSDKDKELSKIKFSKEHDWNILNINVSIADPQTIPRVFLDIVKMMKNFIFYELGNEKALDAFSEELYPYLLNNWNQLQQLNLEKPLFSIFLNYT